MKSLASETRYGGENSYIRETDRTMNPENIDVNEERCCSTPQGPFGNLSDLSAESIKEISGSLNDLLADVFALYLKTKNFHWPMSGPHFRDYHLLLDEQGEQIFAITDDIPERVRKVSPTA
jgi:starvation-inducible DNA-binding protein